MSTNAVATKKEFSIPNRAETSKLFKQHPFESKKTNSQTYTSSTEGITFGELSSMDMSTPLQLKKKSKREDEDEDTAQKKENLGQEAIAQQLPSNEGGFPLPKDVKEDFEAAFQTDFSDIRIHEGAAAKSIGAIAYTQGSHLHFAPSQYNPNTQQGRELLGHELTHVVQQRTGRVTASDDASLPINNDPALEVEADILGAQAARGEVATIGNFNSGLQLKSVATSVQKKDDKQKQTSEVVGNITNTIDVGKNILGFMSDMPSGIGTGFDAISETLKRGAGGEETAQAVGGGLTKALTGGLWDTASDQQWGASKPSVAGLLGSGLKMLGGAMGEQPSPEFGLTDVGEALDLASKMNPRGLVGQGIQEGWMGLYNTLQSGADWLATGNTDAFMKQGEDQLRGASGPITQGYSMIANTIGGAVTGDWSEMYRIGDLADSGALGTLPKLGSKLGDWTYDAVQATKGAASDAWDWTKGAASDVAGTASSAWDWTKGAASDVADTASNAWDWTKNTASGAVDTVSDAASGAWGWAKDKLSFW